MNETQTPSVRRVTKKKLERDAQKLREFARLVFVLNSGVVSEMIDNGNRREKGLPLAKIIAVLGPVYHEGTFLQESVLMEIGYGRTRPYSQLEERPKGEHENRSGHRWHLKPRVRVRGLSKEEFAQVYPLIMHGISVIVEECRANWKTQESWEWTKGPATNRNGKHLRRITLSFPRGIRFTVHNSDALLCGQFAFKGVQYRIEKYINEHAKKLYWLLGEYKSSEYSKKQFENSKNVRSVVSLLEERHYTPHYREVLRQCFSEFVLKEGRQHLLRVFDEITKAFNIDVSRDGEAVHALNNPPMDPSGFAWVKCYHPTSRQPKIHANGSTVFELMIERRPHG